MHFSPRWLRLLSVLRRWFCVSWFIVLCTSHSLWGFVFGLFCYTLLWALSSFAIILTKKRELIVLQLSSWCLVTVMLVYRGSFSRCHGMVCSMWLWSFLIILTYFLKVANWDNRAIKHIISAVIKRHSFKSILLFSNFVGSPYFQRVLLRLWGVWSGFVLFVYVP